MQVLCDLCPRFDLVSGPMGAGVEKIVRLRSGEAQVINPGLS